MPENFSVYMTSFTGEFNYGTKPYSDVPGTDLSTVKTYTDNGIVQLFDSIELNNVVGQFMYTQNYASVKLKDQVNVSIFNIQNSFHFPNGSINTIGSVYGSFDPNGYTLPNARWLVNIVGGTGDFFNSKGNVIVELLDLPFYIEKHTFYFE